MTGIAFDFDGTIIGCRDRQVAVARFAIRSVGLDESTLDESLFWRLKRSGATTRQALERHGFDRAASSQIADRWIDHIEDDCWLAIDPILPGARAVLNEVRNRGWTTMLLTSRRKPDSLHQQLRWLDLDAMFDDVFVVDPSIAMEGKRDLLARVLPVGYIGDTESDFAAAAAAGVPFVGVTTGQRNGAVLRGRGVVTIRRGVRDALAALLPNR